MDSLSTLELHDYYFLGLFGMNINKFIDNTSGKYNLGMIRYLISDDGTTRFPHGW